MAQKPAESDQRKVKFPQVIRYRRAEATIYGKSRQYPRYRLAYYVAGQRRLRTFATYSEAKTEAERIVRELASGSQAAALTAEQSRDALAALERLEAFRQATGKRVSLLAIASEYVEAAANLKGHTLGEAVERFLGTVASVKRKDIAEAAEEFIESRKHKTEAKDGKRPQLSTGYAYNVAMWLREFAGTFPNTAVCDLAKQHLNAYMGQHGKVSAKTRNERRNVVRMFLKWCARQDYLAPNHHLLEADGMARETAEPEEIDFYTAAELRALLENADADVRPVIALCALAGVRVQEAVRLTWRDVFHVPGHVEISTAKSKTRSRRLVTICPALERWLAPYRERSGAVWSKSIDMFQEGFAALRESLKIPRRRNGLRHGFVSYHFALHSNENMTAAEAGNSPAMVHKNYKGLATKAEAEKWFAVRAEPLANVVSLPSEA
ncbi:MAG: hypothetical protein HY735_18090 [Verrucomicrobia bacterium]|nr:hypothetical protein [Verrucomicrobiota bacterium]